MKNPKCKICGRTCSSGVKIEPEDIAPEVKKTLFFCSERCAKVFIASVKRNTIRLAELLLKIQIVNQMNRR